MTFSESEKIDIVDHVVLSHILRVYFEASNIEEVFRQINGIFYDKNSAGHWGEFNYKDRDFRSEDFWKRNESLMRRFDALVALNGVNTYGLRSVFFGKRPFGTELYTMGTDVPETIEKIEIIAITEE